MIIDNFKAFEGESCETTTVGNLLKNDGIVLSEPMLFGIGEGLGFIYWDSKQMGFPFLGGRCKQDVLTERIVINLNLNIDVNETTSKANAWENVKSKIDSGIPVGLKLDCYYLEYFTQKVHFAGHYVTMYGYDEQFAYLIDTVQQGSKVKSSLLSLSDARNARGPMSSRNRSFSIKRNKELPDLRNVIISSVYNNACEYLNPKISNMSFRGIKKTAKVIGKWFERPGMTPELVTQVGVLMEKAGTGGALFRNMYSNFLKECDELYPDLGFNSSYISFTKIAKMWTEVSNMICSAGQNESAQYLQKASSLLTDIAALEEETMKLLLEKVSLNNID